MVDRIDNVIPQINQFHMAGLMVAPMAIIELLPMRAMYPSPRCNAVLIVVSSVALECFWLGIRQQFAIGDGEFLKSTLPHHAGAILMCEHARLGDPEIRGPCEEIIASQQEEIAGTKSLPNQRARR